MRHLIALLVIVILASCAQVSCPAGTERDGGIGGTGGCVQRPLN